MKNNCTYLSIGGITIQMYISVAISIVVEKPYIDFITKNDNADFTISIKNKDSYYDELLNSKKKMISKCLIWDIYENSSTTYIFKNNSEKLIHKGIDFYLENKKVAIYTNSKKIDAKDIFIRPILSHIFSLSNRILLHGAGVIFNNKGYLFLGSSGNGKSTISKIFKNNGKTIVLNDDNIVLSHSNGKIVLYGTPWYSSLEEYSASSSYLNRIFCIHHSAKNTINTPCCMKDSFLNFIPNAYLPYWDIKLSQKVIVNINSVLQVHECPKLGFLPNKSIISFISSL